MSALSRERVEAVKARADAATVGPWVMVTQGGIESGHSTREDRVGDRPERVGARRIPVAVERC